MVSKQLYPCTWVFHALVLHRFVKGAAYTSMESAVEQSKWTIMMWDIHGFKFDPKQRFEAFRSILACKIDRSVCNGAGQHISSFLKEFMCLLSIFQSYVYSCLPFFI